ncbi:hypothetical protein [Leucobacter ruminantium]|uniref:hypothetical protein n=1 Tax=Leucobacter ruminantium TaxID=1289170 RepID=UPI001FB6EBAC|nr:hypothetical protein [Leucobacter ruminantium]
MGVGFSRSVGRRGRGRATALGAGAAAAALVLAGCAGGGGGGDASGDEFSGETLKVVAAWSGDE